MTALLIRRLTASVTSLLMVCLLWYFISSTLNEVSFVISLGAFLLTGVFSISFVWNAKKFLHAFSARLKGDHIEVRLVSGETLSGERIWVTRENNTVLVYLAERGITVSVDSTKVMFVETWSVTTGVERFSFVEFVVRYKL